MITITLLLLAAAIAFGIANATRIPVIPLLIGAGLALGAIDLLPADGTAADTLELGLTFLVFAAGTELNPRRITGAGVPSRRRTGPISPILDRLLRRLDDLLPTSAALALSGRVLRGLAARIALTQFAAVTGITFAATAVAGFDLQSAFLLGLALAASSTLVVVRLLAQRRQLSEPFGRLLIGVLLVQDALVVLLLTATAIADRPGADAPITLGALVGLIALTWVCVRWLTPWLVLRLGLDAETLLLVLLTFLFTFAGVAWLTGLPVVVGAFLAGVSMSAFPVNGVIRSPLSSLNTFFVALFFVSLGAIVVVPSPADLTLAVLLILAVVLLTPLLVAFFAERAGLTARAGVEAGLLLAQTSEFSLVVALMSRDQGWLAPGLFEVIVLVTVVTMALTPMLAHDAVVWRLVRLHPAGRWGRARRDDPPRDHVLLLGCGDNGMHVLQRLRDCGHPVVAVDDDPVIIDELSRLGLVTIRGDGADPRVLRDAGADRARLVISTMRRVEDSLRMMAALAGGTPVLVRVFSPEEADQVTRAGGRPVTYSAAAADAVLAWLEHGLEPEPPSTVATTAPDVDPVDGPDQAR